MLASSVVPGILPVDVEPVISGDVDGVVLDADSVDDVVVIELGALTVVHALAVRGSK